MIVAWSAPALGADAQVDLLLGGRTTPDVAFEQPAEWDPVWEPQALAAVVGTVRANPAPWWAGLDGAMWQYAPEADAMSFSVTPQGGVATELGPARVEFAARYGANWFPVIRVGTSGRAELVVRAAIPQRTFTPELRVEGIDRWYPFQTDWSLRAAEAAVGGELRPPASRWHGGAFVGGQVNEGSGSTGSQLRGTAKLGWTGRRVDLWARYRFIAAFAGRGDVAARSQFTPLGEYSEDADALSSGGFTQSRVESGSAFDLGPVVVEGSALGRWRAASDGDATYTRTGHVQVDVEGPLAGKWWWIATAGLSGAELANGQSFTDLYLWGGLSWRLRQEDGGGESSLPRTEDVHR